MTKITRIDPDLPLCWEDAETVRIGFEVAKVRIRHPSAATQRMLGVLCNGVPTAHLKREAKKVGIAPAEYSTLMATLRPVLVAEQRQDVRPETATPRQLRTTISDNGRAAPGLRQALGALEPCLIDGEARTEESDLIVHVERYLEPLERAQRWRALGIPHLLIRFSDRCVSVGPIIEPEGAPCHSCVSLGLVARDAALPVLAIQLHEKVPRSETAAAGELAAVYAGLLMREWRDGVRAATHTRWVIPVVHGTPRGSPRSEAVPPHPGCSCGSELDTAFAAAAPGAHDAAPRYAALKR